MKPYTHLFQPGKIGNLPVQNRIVMPAVTTGLGGLQGEVTTEMLAYYRERALSGPGIIVAEVVCVDSERGRFAYNSLMGDHPRYTAGLMRLAETIKMGGARAFIQLYHVGRQTSLQTTGGKPPLAPSAVYCRPMRVMPEEASTEEIAALVGRFAGSARVVRAAGFEGVELHAGHGYLLSTFLSPFTNHRQDEYGGSTEKRVRIVEEIIKRVKEEAPAMIVGVRFNASDFVSGGIEPEEGLRIASLLEQAGADYLNVSSGMYESSQTIIEPVNFAEGWRIPLAAAVKERVKIPVMGGGVIRRPETADQIIAEGKTDFVFLGRAQVADPEWIEKARSNQATSIRPCLSCNVCIDRGMKGKQIACTVNPRAGRETWMLPVLPLTGSPKSILVVGGGPAGMAAAASLAGRGHHTVLAEQDSELGGLLNAAAAPPDKYRVVDLKNYLIRELKRSGAKMLLDTPVSRETIRELKPDVIVLAAGSRPKTAAFYDPGDTTVVQAIDVLRRGAEPGCRYLIAGGGITGCETALFLAVRGCQTTLVETASCLARGLQQVSRQELIKALTENGVQLLTGHAISRYGNGTAEITGSRGTQEITADRLVLALGFNSRREVTDEAEDMGIPVYVIGDASEPRSIESALFEAEVLAARL